MSETYPSIGFLTDTGQERSENQDNLVVRTLPWGTLLLVADGMGGHQDGSLASQIAVDVIADMLAQAQPDTSQPAAIQGILWEALVQANQEIWRQATQDGGTSNMGTTAVLAVVIKGRVFVAHVGDSRLYHIRQGLPAQITMDHTTVQAMVDNEIITMAQSKVHPDANKLAKALGVRESVEPDVRAEPILLESGDLLVLCSDGLFDVVTDDGIADLSSRFSAEAAVKQLVQAANQAGGPDNISVIVYQFGKPKVRRSLTRVLPAQRGRLLGLPLWAWILIGVVLAASTTLALWQPWEEEPLKAPSSLSAPVQDEDKQKPTKPTSPKPEVMPPSVPGPGVSNGPDYDVSKGRSPAPTPAGNVQPDPARPERERGTIHLENEIQPEFVSDKKPTGHRGGRKLQDSRKASKCSASAAGAEAGRQVARFLAQLKNVDMYLHARDGKNANIYYRKAKSLHGKLPQHIQGACLDKLLARRVNLKDEFLRLATERAGDNDCAAAKGRADEARNLFGASQDELNQALGRCQPGSKEKMSTHPESETSQGSDTDDFITLPESTSSKKDVEVSADAGAVSSDIGPPPPATEPANPEEKPVPEPSPPVNGKKPAGEAPPAKTDENKDVAIEL